MTKIKLVRLEKEKVSEFKSSVFGGNQLLKMFPEIFDEGVGVFQKDKHWYIYIESKKTFSVDCFFSDEELNILTIIKELENDFELDYSTFLK